MTQYVTQVTCYANRFTYLPVPRLEDAVDIVSLHKEKMSACEDDDEYIGFDFLITDSTGAEVLGSNIGEFSFSDERYASLEKAVETAFIIQMCDIRFDALAAKRTTTQKQSDGRHRKRKKIEQRAVDLMIKAEKERLEYEEELRRRVQNHLPTTVWEKEFNELYEVCAMYSKTFETKHKAWQASLGFEYLNRNHVRKNVVAIQVSIGPSGGYYGVWVPVADIDPDIDFITLYSGPKFSLMDLSALFNKYFREEGFDPGFYVNCNRDSLRLKGLVEWVPPRFPGDTEPPSNTFRLTDRGRAKVESLLEYHSKVYRRMEPAEMFFPRPGGVKLYRERGVLTERQQSLKPYGDCQSLIFDVIEREVRASHKKKEDST